MTETDSMVERVAKAINAGGMAWLNENDPKRMTLSWADVPDEATHSRVFARPLPCLVPSRMANEWKKARNKLARLRPPGTVAPISRRYQPTGSQPRSFQLVPAIRRELVRALPRVTG